MVWRARGLQADSGATHMRAAEPCRVLGLAYDISDDGAEHTLARLRLVLGDGASPLAGREFEVALPPPGCGFAEFVVPRYRFDAAVERRWRVGDACQVHLYVARRSLDAGSWGGAAGCHSPHRA
jgi:hypothetical protein